ncbi:MAG: hypothetical protein ACRD1T_22345, partial [Acidimicrobiia bacterium]
MRTQEASRRDWIRAELETLITRVRRREVAVFTAGLLLFVAGGANLIVTQLRAANSVDTRSGTGLKTSGEKVIGRPSDEGVAPYIARKKSLLASRSKKDASAESVAVISFDSYRKTEELESFVSGNKLSARVAMLRVSLEGFSAEPVPISERGVSALSDEVKARADQEIALAVGLEKLVSNVRDPSFESIYV